MNDFISARAGALLAAAGLCLSAALTPAYAAEPLKVVASFSILGDIVREVGGKDVSVSTLVGPDGDAHEYEPTPADARKLAGAQLLVVNGLDFEAWLPRLDKASGFAGRKVVASEGVTPRKFAGGGHDHGHDHDHDHGKGDADGDKGGHHHHHGDADPHAWQNLERRALRAQRGRGPGGGGSRPCRRLSPARACLRRAHREAGRRDPSDLRRDSAERRKVVTSHDAFGYFGDAYGVTFIAVAGVSTAAEPSAADVARIIEQVKRERVPAVFVENITSPDWCSRSRAKPARRWVVRSIPMPCPSLDSPAPPTWKCLNGTHANSPRPCSPERRRRPAGGFDRQRASPHVDRRARGDRSGRGQAHHRRAAGLAIRRDVRRLCHAGPEERQGRLAGRRRAPAWRATG